jgi:hypothetical protein
MRGYYRHVRRRPPAPAAWPAVAFCAALVLAPGWARAQALPAPVAAAPLRVGLVDVSSGPAGHAAVAALRARLSTHAGVALPQDAARAALEDPLPLTGERVESAAERRATQLVRTARDAYSRFDYDGALERLRQAELALATAAPEPELWRRLVEIELFTGVVEADRGDAPRALEAFRVARRLDPARVALDPGSYRPKVVALYAQAGANPPPRDARLQVVTDPAGAEVFVDGRRAGVAPLAAALEAGPHFVAVVDEGDVPRLERPLLRAGQETRISLLLSRSPPEERARRARADLAAGRLDWDRGPAAIAASASLDLLVLVRDAPAEGTPEALSQAAIYDARAASLGAFMPAAPPEPVLVALGAALAARQQPAPPALASGPGGERDRSSAAAAPWYRTWWIAPPLLAVGAAVGLGTLWIIDRGRTTTYAINRWCFNNTCAPQ